MKKLSQISNKIKNDNFSYTGKGSFESIFLNNKDEIIVWLEELVPLQKQIELLYEKENIEFQKRNYTRILTKFLPKEYTEFVSLNILLRDLDNIKDVFTKELSLISIYNKLVLNRYLKYPGKSEKFVEFEIFEEFTNIYKEELSIPSAKPTKIIQQKELPVEKTKEIEEEEEKQEPKAKKEEKINWTNLLLGKK